MDWIETTGKTIDEAKEAALDELGVDEQDAEFEVVAEPKTGLFGRMRVEARVRARVRPTAPRPKDDRRDRKRKGRSERTTEPGLPAVPPWLPSRRPSPSPRRLPLRAPGALQRATAALARLQPQQDRPGVRAPPQRGRGAAPRTATTRGMTG
jgi:hypothetical protein